MPKDEGEGLHPDAEELDVVFLPGDQPQALEHREVAAEADRQGRKDDMEGDREGELDAGQHDRVEGSRACGWPPVSVTWLLRGGPIMAVTTPIANRWTAAP